MKHLMKFSFKISYSMHASAKRTFFLLMLSLMPFTFSNNTIACEKNNGTQTAITTQQTSDSFETYFSPQNDLAQILAEYITQEKKSIKIAIYRLNDYKIINALCSAVRKGITVRIIIDKEDNDEFDHKKDIKTLATTKRNLSFHTCKLPNIVIMHHKFVIFEQNKDNKPWVWMGSYNFTFYEDIKESHESVIVLNNPSMIDKFKHEFNRLEGKKTESPQPPLMNNQLRAVFFSPNGGCQQALIMLIKGEKTSIKACINEFTDQEIVQALVDAKNAGVKVHFIVFKTAKNKNDITALTDRQIKQMQDSGILISKYKKRNKEIMHHKFALFGNNEALIQNHKLSGRPVAWVGSYNFTQSAEKNNCESVIVVDEPSLFSKFSRQFEGIRMILEKTTQRPIKRPTPCCTHKENPRNTEPANKKCKITEQMAKNVYK